MKEVKIKQPKGEEKYNPEKKYYKIEDSDYIVLPSAKERPDLYPFNGFFHINNIEIEEKKEEDTLENQATKAIESKENSTSADNLKESEQEAVSSSPAQTNNSNIPDINNIVVSNFTKTQACEDEIILAAANEDEIKSRKFVDDDFDDGDNQEKEARLKTIQEQEKMFLAPLEEEEPQEFNSSEIPSGDEDDYIGEVEISSAVSFAEEDRSKELIAEKFSQESIEEYNDGFSQNLGESLFEPKGSDEPIKINISSDAQIKTGINQEKTEEMEKAIQESKKPSQEVGSNYIKIEDEKLYKVKDEIEDEKLNEILGLGNEEY
ncbi:hypothetical protein [Campylobacter sp. RM16188]|uniref:hypothetical protein n=1 Tax=Campylobacter sp. RM16188 TaxID=1705725 RepID=UPI001552B436|nr:hypothetical protein [Campylobacter sp. RM16188]